jgi:hypothetical protein
MIEIGRRAFGAKDRERVHALVARKTCVPGNVDPRVLGSTEAFELFPEGLVCDRGSLEGEPVSGFPAPEILSDAADEVLRIRTEFDPCMGFMAQDRAHSFERA